MKTITIGELEKLNSSKITIIDVRKFEDYKRGSIENSINIPISEFNQKIDTIPKDKPVYLLCYTGDKSIDITYMLSDLGYDAYNIEGGYRAYLQLYLISFNHLICK